MYNMFRRIREKLEKQTVHMHGRVDITVSCSLSNETPDTFLSFSFGFAEMMIHIVNTNQSLLVQNKQNHLIVKSLIYAQPAYILYLNC